MKIKLSKSQWKEIGRKAGWTNLEEGSDLMRAVKITFEDGNIISTNINGSKDEVLDYYLGKDRKGKVFNLGREDDDLVRAISVDFI